MANILVYALQYEGAFNKNSLGAVSEAAKLASEIGGEAHAIVVGEGVSDDLCSSLGNYGATKVLRAEGPEGLAQPVVDAMAAAIGAGDYGYSSFAEVTFSVACLRAHAAPLATAPAALPAPALILSKNPASISTRSNNR